MISKAKLASLLVVAGVFASVAIAMEYLRRTNPTDEQAAQLQQLFENKEYPKLIAVSMMCKPASIV